MPNRKTILLVEDEPIIRLAETKILEQKGYKVIAVPDGEKAVKTVQGGYPIDLILIDINLGKGMDGTEAAREILKDHDIPVVFLSCHTEKDIVERTEKINFYGYVMKDSGITILDASIKMAFKLHEAHREIKKKEEVVRKSEMALAEAQHVAGIGSWEYDVQSDKPIWSKEMFRIFGIDPSLGEPSWEEHCKSIHPDDWHHIDMAVRTAINDGTPYKKEFRIIHPDGNVLLGLTIGKVLKDASGKVLKLYGTVQDITDRKRSEEALQKSNETLRTLVNSSPLAIIALDPNGNVTQWNPAAVRMFGWQEHEVLGRFLPIVSEDKRDEHHALRKRVLRDEGLDNVEARRRKKNGSPIDISISTALLRDSRGHATGIISVSADITERKQAEETLKISEEKYRLLVDNAAEAIFVAQGGMLKFVNPKAIEITGYSEEQLKSRPFVDFIHPDDKKFVSDNYSARLEGAAVPSVYEFRIITKDDGIIWVELNTVRFTWQEKGATLNFLNDITERKLAEESLKQTLEKLRKSLAGTIQAMSLTVETRDPYTAGHQRRVSNLARAIAQEMGLSNDTVDNIRMAGIIHDIGKISVPAEILAKPTRLTDIEMSLIKVHSRSGYDILKDVELPYPIAKIVLQHHERLDGSGYPRGLKSDRILLETKILSVADVVEAIATHRPYRPALGIETALEEIEKSKGTLYDAEVVEVCLKLFREKRFEFE